MKGKKFSAPAIGLALGTISMWAFQQYTKMVVPAEVGVALGVILTALVSAVIPDEAEAE